VVARLLKNGRITKERVAKIVSAITLGVTQPATATGCGGCDARQAWLNNWPAPRWLAHLAGFKKT
jgi:hypothetical protein